MGQYVGRCPNAECKSPILWTDVKTGETDSQGYPIPYFPPLTPTPPEDISPKESGLKPRPIFIVSCANCGTRGVYFWRTPLPEETASAYRRALEDSGIDVDQYILTGRKLPPMDYKNMRLPRPLYKTQTIPMFMEWVGALPDPRHRKAILDALARGGFRFATI